MYLYDRHVSQAQFQQFCFSFALLLSLILKMAFDHKQIIIISLHYRTYPELELIRLPVPAAAAAEAADFIDIFGSPFSAVHLLQTKPFSSHSFEFQPTFILYCQRPTWPHLCAVCPATDGEPQTPLSSWSHHRPVCKYTAQSHRTVKPHYWLLCKFWVLCWELCVTAALREEQRPWV